MPCRLCLPATLFGHAMGSRALMGSGPSGVAGALRRVLQRKSLQSLCYSPLQQLQRLQRPSPSRRHRRGRAEARAGASTRGLGPVASVASVADDNSIYISMNYLQRPLQRRAAAASDPVADHPCSISSAAPQAIKYPRIFKGLGSAELHRAEIAGNGVLGVSASASRRAREAIGQGRAEALDQGEMGRFPPSSPVYRPPVASAGEQYQGVRPALALTVLAMQGVASPGKAPPLPLPGAVPPAATRPLFAARFGATAPGLPAFPDRRGENADRWGVGARGSGAPGSGPAKTGVLETMGSGEAQDG